MIAILCDDCHEWPCVCQWRGIKPETVKAVSQQTNAADVLAEMAKTYRERNAVYGDNFRMVGPMMKVLFPAGVPPEVLHSDQFHLFELMLVKLSRFAVSKLQHKDSIHDAAVYGAMIESIIVSNESQESKK